MTFLYNSTSLESAFSDVISADFSRQIYLLEIKYEKKYKLRHAYGLDSELDDIQLMREQLKEEDNCKRYRNYCWYLMKTGAYAKLDLELGTSFCDDYLAALNIQDQKKNNIKKIKKRSTSEPLLFSKCTFLYNDIDDEEVPTCHEDEVELLLHRMECKWYKRPKKTRYELLDVPHVVHNIPQDIRDYNVLSRIALRLRRSIEHLEFVRKRWLMRLKNIQMFYKIRNDDIEMDVFYDASTGNCQVIKEPCISDSDWQVIQKDLDNIKYQGNVEQDVGGDTSVVQTDTAHNVVLTETEITQADRTGQFNAGWSAYTSSDVVSNMDSLVDRWFRVGTYSWTTSMNRNATIVSIDLPRTAILQGTTTCNQPNKIPFRIHRFWRGDMIVKIHINCNKFQIGQLQCSWYYQPKADNSFATKANVFTRSGTHHCVISAAPNNEVELRIPFKSFKSMYHTKSFSGDQKGLPLDLGTLFVTVLSPLKTTGETSPKCSFTVFVRFVNSEFTGLIAGDIDTPVQEEEPLSYQMDGVGSLVATALPVVERLLTSSANDNNRDNPPYNNAPSFLVPTASHSWSIGTDLAEPLHNLRLSGKAQTNHPDTDIDEMKIDVLKRKYMLQDIFTWSQQNNNGQLLWSLPVNPIPPKDRLFVVQQAASNTLRSYQLTPIGFISSMFQYWRGSIEFRFDIVASQFHSGKLLLAYIPGVAEGAEVTIEQARASANIVISLDNAMSYTWRVPYVADRPWWPRRYSGESVTNNSFSPSKIFVFVLNELVMADTVPDSIEILVYMRGGSDMEFAVPVQPCIGLGYDRNYVASRDPTNVFPVSTTDTYYAGNWHITPQVLVWRHATTSEAVGRFSAGILNRPAYYQLTSALPGARRAAFDTQIYYIRHCIFLRVTTFSEWIGLPIYATDEPISIAIVEQIARAAFANNYNYGEWVTQFGVTINNPSGFILGATVTTANTYGGGKTNPWVAVEVSPTLEDLEFQGNREDQMALVDNATMLHSTQSGRFMFGESFVDLKDLCRRYQIYGWTTIPKENIERDPGACSFLFPVLPQGLALAVNTPTQVNQIWNRAREGHIPLIASLYRFYRGSIRVRIVVTNANGLVMWLQHRPDRRLERDVITSCVNVTTAEAVFNHTYGVYMQDMDVNSVVEVEVPYYQMSNFGLLQKPVVQEGGTLSDWSHFYSLGELSIGFFGNQPTADVRCSIFYSIADDCRFTTYQGVPPMVLIDDLPDFQEALHYQGITDFFKASPKAVGNELGEGVSETFLSNIQPALQSFLESFKTTVSDTYGSVKQSISECDIASKITHIVSQILHAINNPSATTIAISIISILITIGVVSYAVYNILHDYILDIWKFIVKKVSSNESQEEGSSQQEPMNYQDSSEDKAVVGFMSLIFGGLCTVFGYKADRDKYTPMSDALFKNIDKGMRLSNVCFVFFRNLMTVIEDMKEWIVRRLYPGFDAADAILEGKDIIDKWVTLSQELFDPINSQNIKYNVELQSRFIDCYAFGKILRVRAKETNYLPVIQLVNSTYDKLHKVHIDLVAQGLDPQIRKMPFVIYNYGAPEIGKSHLTTDIATELCKSQGIKTETNLMCVLNATSKFWDNCDRQPVLVMDDAFNIRKGPMLEDQLANIFNVVSPVVLVPPKAAVEEKGRPYNPEIFVMNSNEAFFKTEIVLDQALWRRRDILIKTELDPDFKKEGCPHCINNLKVNASLPKEAIPYLKDYHHLRFKYTYDVTNPDCVYLPDNRYIKYSELLELLKKIFKQNREAEQVKFAARVEANNEIVGLSNSLSSQVDNLEQLWNNAIARRNAANELLRNSTFSSIRQCFQSKVSDAVLDLKHNILSRVLSVIKPNDNRYLLKNPTCIECCRIKYQCIGCRRSLREALNEDVKNTYVTPSFPGAATSDLFPIPSTSTTPDLTQSDSISIISSEDKLEMQGDTLGVVDDAMKEYESFKNELPERTWQWFVDMFKTYNDFFLDKFRTFLEINQLRIIVELRRYPLYSRSVYVFKNVCEKLCSCIHNVSVNRPVIYNSSLAFINPSKPSVPDVLENYVCTDYCWLCLPWKMQETAQYSVKHYSHTESWMSCILNTEISTPSSIDSIMTGLLKYVYDFYYDKMKPLAKCVFSFFTSIKGWVLGLSFMSALLSTVILGMGVVGGYEALKQERIITKEIQKCSQEDWVYVGNSSALRDADAQSRGYSIEFENKTYSDPGKAKHQKHPKPKARVPVKATKELVYESAQQFSIIEDRIRENIASIVVYVDNDGLRRRIPNYGLMIHGQTMLIQQHYYNYWKTLPATAEFYFVSDKIKDPMGVRITNVFDLELEWFNTPNVEYIDSNFGLLHLPLTVPSFKDISKFIAKTVDHEHIRSTDVFLYSVLEKRLMHCNLSVTGPREITSDGWMRLDECYAYQYSQKGLCGSVLISRNLERPIIGVHFAGTSVQGFAEPIVQESFIIDDRDHKEYRYVNCNLYTDDNEKPKVDFDTYLYPQGCVPKAYAHHQGSVSQFIPSLIQGVYDVDTEPNPLSAKDPRLGPNAASPLKTGCEFMGKPPLEFPKELIDSASLDLENMILTNVIPIRKRVGLVSLEDAICGNSDIEGFQPLEWSSSEGFPLRALRPPGKKGKRWLFDLEETNNGYKLKGLHGELKRQLYICNELRKNNTRVPTVFVDCLKDTCIDAEKCKIPGKTRIFSISPVQYTIAFKQYFNDFLASYQASRVTAEHGIGINVDSVEWTKVANLLTSKSAHIVAGDYKNFGPSLMLSCVKKCFDIILAWYARYDNDTERMRVRRVLLSEILHAKHLCLNVLYGVPCGIPSGSPITTPLNSMVNSLYLRCAWREICQQDFSVMHEHIAIITYGDDVCINVSNAYISLYNTSTLNLFFKKYGIIFTDIDKSDNIIPYRSLNNITFLKRGFIRHPINNMIYLAPIEEQSIRKCVSWITRKGDPVLNTLENCVQACELAFGHGPEYYNSVREKLSRECIERLGKSFSSPSWYEKSERCYGF